MKPFIGTLAVCFTLSSSAFSQGPSDTIDYETARLSRIATAVRATEKITVDGKLEEPTWMLAIPATDFTQQRPHPGELATQRTEARFIYDDENLYVGIICFDSDPEHITVNSLQRDYPHPGVRWPYGTDRQSSRPAFRIHVCHQPCRREARPADIQ